MAQIYGSAGQVHFTDWHQYYYALGILAMAKRTSLVWEHNENQGAWASEGRIHIYADVGLFTPFFDLTTGTGKVLRRVNCNDYVSILQRRHNFVLGKTQNVPIIMSSVPRTYWGDFVRGLAA